MLNSAYNTKNMKIYWLFTMPLGAYINSSIRFENPTTNLLMI